MRCGVIEVRALSLQCYLATCHEGVPGILTTPDTTETSRFPIA